MKGTTKGVKRTKGTPGRKSPLSLFPVYCFTDRKKFCRSLPIGIHSGWLYDWSFCFLRQYYGLEWSCHQSVTRVWCHYVLCRQRLGWCEFPLSASSVPVPTSLFPLSLSLFIILTLWGSLLLWISRVLKDNSSVNKVIMSFQVIFFAFLLIS